MKRIASVSGGKDSTAMLILLYEQGVSLDYIVFMNTGIEFPQTVRFVREKLSPWCKEHFGKEVTFIYPKRPFGYYFKKYGVPYYPRGRWCCRVLKKDTFYYWVMSSVEDKDIALYVGYSADEKRRFEKALKETNKYWSKRRKNITLVAPLIDLGITESKALEICKKHDLLNPLYKHFNRTGCWLCPFQSIDSWRVLHDYYPHLWKAAVKIESLSIKLGKKTFRPEGSLPFILGL